jgi:glycosyltransferase involved in cell wall biosynthesis
MVSEPSAGTAAATGRPLLSICVPVYNRPDYFEPLLRSIDEQQFPLPYEVRIRDDASPAALEPIFRAVARGRPNWHYHRNATNLGGIVNIHRCTEDAIGEFIFMPSDDDRLAPGTFALAARLIELAQGSNAAVIFNYERLSTRLVNGEVLRHGFEWLRDVSINVPAMISTTVWRRAFWLNYDYFGYPQSLPQLDCFIDACITSKVVACSTTWFLRGEANPTNRKSYWFYSRNPLLDAYEYPALYRKVLASGKVDRKTWWLIQGRRLKLLSWAFRKLLFIRHNRAHYHPTVARWREAHQGTWYWPLLWVIVVLVLKTPLGAALAYVYCEWILKADRLPATPADPYAPAPPTAVGATPASAA